jgi:NitT/TauT family transport system substrate-binding protein
MQIMQSRRDFMASASLAAAVGALGTRASLADEAPSEVTTIRIRVEDAPPLIVGGVAENALCTAPLYITEDLLRAEGFTDIRYVLVKNGPPYAQAFERGEIDFGLRFAPGAVRYLDAGVPIKVLAGVHPGCFELFVHEHIRTFTDLKANKSASMRRSARPSTCTYQSWPHTSGSTPRTTDPRGFMRPAVWPIFDTAI